MYSQSHTAKFKLIIPFAVKNGHNIGLMWQHRRTWFDEYALLLIHLILGVNSMSYKCYEYLLNLIISYHSEVRGSISISIRLKKHSTLPDLFISNLKFTLL